MTAPAFIVDRILEIQRRFEPPPVRPSASEASTATFSTALASALGSTTVDPAAAHGATGAVDGNDVVAAATRYLGIPYRWGGTDPDTGLDCSGLVQRVFRDLGIELPRVSRDQARQGTPVASLDEARPGDLIAFGSPVDHIAIYVGDGKILHAPRTGDVVKVSDIHRPIAAIRRIVPDANPTLQVPIGTKYLPAAMLLGASGSFSVAGVGTSVLGIPGAEPYAALFVDAARRYGLNPRLLAAVAKVESNFDPTARSAAGARGLMQFMPGTAAGLGIDPDDPAQAIDGAARYLRQQLDRFGTVELALAAYNAGPGNVARHGGVPPFTETRNYVARVTGLLGGQSALTSLAA